MQSTVPTCEGCLAPLSVMDAVMSASSPNGIDICMPCVKARHRAAMSGRCKCGSKRRPTEVLGRPRQRQWIACHRCLGTIEQVA